MRKAKVTVDRISWKSWTFEVDVPEPGDEGYDEIYPTGCLADITEAAVQQAYNHDYTARSVDLDTEYEVTMVDGGPQ